MNDQHDTSKRGAPLNTVPVLSLNDLSRTDHRFRVGEAEVRITQPAIVELLAFASRVRATCWEPVRAAKGKKKGPR